MNTRNQMALTCQDGASNRRRVSRALHEAIEECAAQGVDADADPAVFLILHQLTFLLTGHDLALSGALNKRYHEAMKALEMPDTPGMGA